MKQKKVDVFICDICGYENIKWFGKCPQCGEWNSSKKITIDKSVSKIVSSPLKDNDDFISSSEFGKTKRTDRLSSGSEQLNRVLGGGIVPGSVILIGGDPGVGKSTILTQLCLSEKFRSFYISGEESFEQIMLRRDRVSSESKHEFFILSSMNLEYALKTMEKKLAEEQDIQPLLIVDSIQTMKVENNSSLPGGAVQIRECTSRLVEFAKSKKIPVFIVAHITKGGQIAGPKLIEHLVDVVLYFEGDKDTDLRIMRSNKNRFGPTNEIGVFEMKEKGLQEVSDPSERFYDREYSLPGNALATVLEGSTPIITEVQSLVVRTQFSAPKRLSKGLDIERVSLVTAVLSKRLSIPVEAHDIYVNLLGGIKIKDPAVELPLAVAIYSSFADKVIPPLTSFFGEIGLDGKIRPVSYPEKRITELMRLGFKTAVVPFGISKKLDSDILKNLEIIEFKFLRDALQYFLK